jgi:hypothetical protein
MTIDGHTRNGKRIQIALHKDHIHIDSPPRRTTDAMDDDTGKLDHSRNSPEILQEGMHRHGLCCDEPNPIEAVSAVPRSTQRNANNVDIIEKLHSTEILSDDICALKEVSSEVREESWCGARMNGVAG